LALTILDTTDLVESPLRPPPQERRKKEKKEKRQEVSPMYVTAENISFPT